MRFNASLSSRGRGCNTDECIQNIVEQLAAELFQYGYKIVDKSGNEVKCFAKPLAKMPPRRREYE